jgi:hypothetical protein
MAKRGIASHPKTLDLAERLGIMDCYAVGILETFWQWVANYHPDGDLTGTKMSIFGRGISYRGNAKKVWDALVAAGFIDHCEGKFFVHDWSEHADDSIQLRLARSRSFFADGTMPKLHRISKEERTQIQQDYEKLVRTGSAPRSALKSAPPKPLPKPKPTPESDERAFDLDRWIQRLYSAHVKRKDKPLVVEALQGIYERCVARGVDPERKFAEIEASLVAWNQTPQWREDNGRFAPSLANWLTDEGYETIPKSGEAHVENPEVPFWVPYEKRSDQ